MWCICRHHLITRASRVAPNTPHHSDGFAASPRKACSAATTCAPSPMAPPTRLTEPERTSPTANTPGTRGFQRRHRAAVALPALRAGQHEARRVERRRRSRRASRSRDRRRRTGTGCGIDAVLLRRQAAPPAHALERAIAVAFEPRSPRCWTSARCWASPRCGRSDSATCWRRGRRRAPSCGPCAHGRTETPPPGRRNCRRRPARPPGRRTAAPRSARPSTRRRGLRSRRGSRSRAAGSARRWRPRWTARATLPAFGGQRERAVAQRAVERLHRDRDQHLGAEFLRLVEGAAGERLPGDAGRKAEVVLDARAGAGLAAERARVEHHHRQALRTPA